MVIILLNQACSRFIARDVPPQLELASLAGLSPVWGLCADWKIADVHVQWFSRCLRAPRKPMKSDEILLKSTALIL